MYTLISFPLLWDIQIISILTCKALNQATAECFKTSNIFNSITTWTGSEILWCPRPAFVLPDCQYLTGTPMHVQPS